MTVLSDFVDSVTQRGGALVLRGPAGIGKSVLLHAAMERARGQAMLVLSTTGTQMEARLPFAGLHQLLRPLLGQADALPAPQRSALLAAFGMTDAVAPDLFLVALAALELLSDAASETPVFAMVEDAHWLDRPSAEVLAFISRRLRCDPIVFLFAIRDDTPAALDEAGLSELAVRGLDPAAAATLLDTHAPGLAEPLRERILVEAEGNPLALVELPAAIAAGQLGSGDLLPARLPLTARLESTFAARQADLPPATRRILLVGAANDGGAVADVLRAASIADGTERSLEDFAPAASAGLIDIRSMQLQCRHPLVRSAIYQAASDVARQTVHRALAEVFVDQPDRRVWHLAAASTGPDEFIARDLVDAADRARRRGGALTAVAALERAAQLSPDQSRRGTRLLQASELAFELGRRDTVRRLLADAEALPLDAAQQTQAAWLHEIFDDGLRESASGIHVLVDEAGRVARSDPALALKLLTGAGLRCWWADLGPDVRRRVVDAAQLVTVDPDDPRLISVLAYADPDGQGTLVHGTLTRLARGARHEAGAARLYGLAAMSIGAHDAAGPFLSAAVDGLRAEGRVGLLAQSLIARSKSSLHRGDLRAAFADVNEGSRLAAETSQHFWATGSLGAASMVAGLRGDEPSALALAAEAEAAALPSRASAALSDVQLARGVTALGCGRPDEAFTELRRMFDPRDPAHHYMKTGWAIGDLAEAARQSGQIEETRPLLEALERARPDSPSPRLRLALIHARCLLAEDHAAEAAFRVALELDLRAWPLTRARVHLAYGEWLRRQRRGHDARGPLRLARDTFDALGAAPWSERARAELRATGERSDLRPAEAWDQLTPQELQIAEMAAEGLSNREIGQRLYLSHRTVGSHLYRIFPKLGVSSRHELRSALAGGSVDAQSHD